MAAKGTGGGESDPGRALWFAYSPLHNPVAVIHHASAARSPAGRKCNGASTQRIHPCRVDTRCTWVGEEYTCAEERKGVHCTRSRFRAGFLSFSFSHSRFVVFSPRSASRFDDSSGEFASLESATWVAATLYRNLLFFLPLLYFLESVRSIVML